MPKIIDLTNQYFGNLKVIEIDKEKSEKMKRKYWICECKCGKTTSVASDKLRSGHTTSCGCKKFEQAENLLGKIFGDLQVVERNYEEHKDGAVWNCKCLLCNNEQLIPVKAVNLKLGKTTSCGCSKKSKGERLIEKILKDNNFNYKTQYCFEDLKGDSSYLKFDFAIFDSKNQIKCLIEYQGQQHYSSVSFFGGEEKFNKQKKYDELKKQYCKNKQIQLIEVPYEDYNILSLEYLLGMMSNGNV